MSDTVLDRRQLAARNRPVRIREPRTRVHKRFSWSRCNMYVYIYVSVLNLRMVSTAPSCIPALRGMRPTMAQMVVAGLLLTWLCFGSEHAPGMSVGFFPTGHSVSRRAQYAEG